MTIDKIYNEDCLMGMKRIPDGTVDCIITDPPYELENQGGGFWSKSEDPKAKRYNARGTRKGMERLGDIKDGRHYIGFEVNRKYFRQAEQRIDEERRYPSFFNI